MTDPALLAEALRVLGDEKIVEHFMNTPHSELGGKTPAESDENAVRRILAAIEYGLPS